ncbi:MAG: alpha/beta hydrolase [Bacteroidota bacterium]
MKYKFSVVFALLVLSCQSVRQLVNKQYVDGDGVNISYVTAGEGQPLVLIHAGGLDKGMWQNQLRELSKYFRVLAYDVRGHGSSVSTSNDQFEIDDLNALLNQEVIDQKINILGCSLGAIIALDYAIAHPGKVDHMILMSPGLIGFQEHNEEFLQQISHYVAALQTGDQAAVIEELKRMNAIGKTDRIIDPDISDYVEDRLAAYIDRGSHLRIPKLAELNPIPRLDALTMETLVLYGDLDFDYIAENAKKLDEGLQNAELVEVSEAAHLINLEQGELFSQLVQDFIRQ